MAKADLPVGVPYRFNSSFNILFNHIISVCTAVISLPLRLAVFIWSLLERVLSVDCIVLVGSLKKD